MNANITHVFSYPYHGGIQEYALNLARAQNKLGYDVNLYTSGVNVDHKELKWVNITPSLNVFRTPINIKLANSVLMNKSNFVHLHVPFPITGDLVILLNILKRKKKKIFLTYHCDIDLIPLLSRVAAKIYNKLVLKLVLGLSDGIFVTSKRFVENSTLLKDFYDKINIVPIGVDTKKFIPSYSTTNEILFVGRIIPEKGVHYLIESLTNLDRRINLKIIGQIIDKQYYRSLLDQIKKLNLGDRVKFTGHVSSEELLFSYQTSAAVVLPSTTRLESFGITLLEAMATGKPVIASNSIPGAVEVISKSGGGILVPPKDVVALGKAINYVTGPCGLDMGEKARKYVEKYCDWEVIAGEITKEYFNAV